MNLLHFFRCNQLDLLLSRDPSLWMVKCRMGEEKQTVLQLMRKSIAYASTNEPLQIKTVIAPEGIKGYIYVEAYKQTHVKQVRQRIQKKFIVLGTMLFF